MLFQPKLTVKQKLLFCMGMLIIVSILSISVVNYYKINRYSIDNYQFNLSNTSEIISKAIEEKIKTYFISLEETASSLIIYNKKPILNDHVFNRLIDNKKRLNVSNYFIALPDGSLFTADSKGFNAKVNAKTSNREWYVKLMKGDMKVVTTPFKASSGRMSISMAIPVYNKGEIIAIVGLSLLMDDLTLYINELSPNSDIFVTRSDGYLMTAPEPKMIGENLFKIRPSFKKYAFEKQSSHSYQVPEQNGNFYAVSKKSDYLNWTVWSLVDWNDIKEMSTKSLTINIIVGVGFIVIGLMIMSFLIKKYMYDPVGGEPDYIECLVDKIANGDLTGLPELNEHDIGIYRATIIMSQKLKKMIQNINSSSEYLVLSSGQLENAVFKVNDLSKLQKEHLEQVVVAINEMKITVEHIAKSAVDASCSSNLAGDSSLKGLSIVKEMNADLNILSCDISTVQNVINHVNSATENVWGILDVIRGIADQTNLLALNAAIEAARAGEHGRGFAVVADEVRTLATKTQQSTNEIQNMIEKLQGKVYQSVLLMDENVKKTNCTLEKSNQTSQVINNIKDGIQQIKNMNNQIAIATEEQSHVASEINKNIILTNSLAKDVDEQIKNNFETAEALNLMALDLRNSISFFKV